MRHQLTQQSPPSESSRLGTGAKQLLKTAERLIAVHGLGAVSTRMIAREAGQKNHSALHYHFRNKEGLIEAILDYRITPVNMERQRRMQRLQKQGRPIRVEQLVEVFIGPFAEELLKPAEDTAYISMLAQLYATQSGRDLYAKNRDRARALHDITSQLIKILHPVPVAVIHLRLQLLGRQTITSIAEWDEARRCGAIDLDQNALRWRISNLVDFLVGGLLAQISES